MGIASLAIGAIGALLTLITLIVALLIFCHQNEVADKEAEAVARVLLPTYRGLLERRLKIEEEADQAGVERDYVDVSPAFPRPGGSVKLKLMLPEAGRNAWGTYRCVVSAPGHQYETNVTYVDWTGETTFPDDFKGAQAVQPGPYDVICEGIDWSNTGVRVCGAFFVLPLTPRLPGTEVFHRLRDLWSFLTWRPWARRKEDIGGK